jgi:immune inhibitor A
VKRRNLRVLTGVAVTALAISTMQIPAQAANAPTDRDPAATQAKKSDDLKSPLSDKQRALRETAVQQVIKGTAKIETKGGQQVINVGKGQYVEYAVNREESIFTILTDFGDASKKGIRGTAGPLHNQIVAPDRSLDNSTYWTNDFNKGHYQD